MNKNSYATLFPVCKNGLLTCNPQYEPFPIVSTLGDVLLGTIHDGNLDANDLVVLQFFFPNPLIF
jgi:hypothetical protein